MQKHQNSPQDFGPLLRRFHRGEFEGAVLAGSAVVGTKLFGANLGRANLTLADFVGADLRRGKLRADARSANFSGLTCARPIGGGADFEGVALIHADLRGAKLTGGGPDRSDPDGVKLPARATLCKTSMPDGSVGNLQPTC